MSQIPLAAYQLGAAGGHAGRARAGRSEEAEDGAKESESGAAEVAPHELVLTAKH